jgi:hypothetical protein
MAAQDFDREVIQRIAVLETKMDIMIQEVKTSKSSGLTTKEKALYGGLVIALTGLINVVAAILQRFI